MTNEYVRSLHKRVQKQHGPKSRLQITETWDSDDGYDPQFTARVTAPGIAGAPSKGQTVDSAVGAAIDAAFRDVPGEPFPLP